MRLQELKKLLHKACRHHEEWHCGPAMIRVYGRDENPRFDRRMDVYLNLPPSSADVQKIAGLLALLDKTSKQITFTFGRKRRAPRRRKAD